jgi:hypothetical protein
MGSLTMAQPLAPDDDGHHGQVPPRGSSSWPFEEHCWPSSHRHWGKQMEQTQEAATPAATAATAATQLASSSVDHQHQQRCRDPSASASAAAKRPPNSVGISSVCGGKWTSSDPHVRENSHATEHAQHKYAHGNKTGSGHRKATAKEVDWRRVAAAKADGVLPIMTKKTKKKGLAPWPRCRQRRNGHNGHVHAQRGVNKSMLQMDRQAHHRHSACCTRVASWTHRHWQLEKRQQKNKRRTRHHCPHVHAALQLCEARHWGRECCMVRAGR